jgi:hypothetical protein
MVMGADREREKGRGKKEAFSKLTEAQKEMVRNVREKDKKTKDLCTFFSILLSPSPLSIQLL